MHPHNSGNAEQSNTCSLTQKRKTEGNAKKKEKRKEQERKKIKGKHRGGGAM